MRRSVASPALADLAEQFAAELRVRLDAFRDGGDELTDRGWSGLDDVFDEAFRTVALVVLDERLRELDPVAFARAFGRVLGSERLLEELRRWEERQLEALRRANELADIERLAAIHRVLDLRRLERGEVLVIGLFDPSRPQLAAARHADDRSHGAHLRTVRLRLDEPSTGTARVLGDNWNEPVRHADDRVPALAPWSVVRIGGVGGFGGGDIEPLVAARAPLAYRVDEDPSLVAHPQIVGFVATATGHLLLDGSESPVSGPRHHSVDPRVSSRIDQ